MSANDGSTTNLSLLGHLRRDPNDQHAWRTFVDRYGRKVYAWCRHWGLQEADARDVTQNVLLDLARQMTQFEYRASGSFRGWLKTVAYRSWCDFLRARGKSGATNSNGDAVLNQLAAPAAGEDLVKQLDAARQREVLQAAMDRVQPHTWQAFQLTALEGLSGADVAARLGMQVGTVYVARGKVQRMLQDEVRRLDEKGE